MTSKLIRLEATNFKRLRAVEIRPSESGVTVVAGNNAQGKSSVLDAIQAALGGGHAAPTKPVRDGEKKALVVCELDDLTIRRSFTTNKGGGTLTVTATDGAKLRTPQKVLDRLYSSLSFDPLAFTRMGPTDQANEVQRIAGIDVDDLRKLHAEQYAARRAERQDVKRLEAKLAEMPHHDDAPDEEVSLEDLELEQAAAVKAHGERIVAQGEVDRLRKDYDEICERIAGLVDERERIRDAGREAKERLDAMPDVDRDAIAERIADAASINQKVRDNLARAGALGELDGHRANAATHDDQLKQLKQQIDDAIAAADLPVDGLAFTEDGVTLDGVPFAQASQAEQLRASVAMGIAANPELKLLLIRDGSLLDDAHLKLVAELAEAHGMQILIERVGTDDPAAVIIEDGSIVDGGAE